jgi:tRNA A-37 threonylcarbamoyl transferase component Bud32
VQLGSAFDRFVEGYVGTAGEKKARRVLENVHEIEKRGRYARVT